MTNRKIEFWAIPPEADAEFIAHMEAVLDIYGQPYNLSHLVLCVDEQPVQLQREGMFHKAPEPERARVLVHRIEFWYPS